MRTKISPFLMFEGNAKEVMDHYISLFGDASIQQITYYDESEEKVQYAIFKIFGQEFMCIDSSVDHEFGFTPAISFYISCDSEQEFSQLFDKLTRHGKVFMEPDSYGFSTLYAWLEDKFGVSWQLNLE